MARNTAVSFGGTSPYAQTPLGMALRNPQYQFGAQTLADASDASPVSSVGEGYTRLARALLGGVFMHQGQETERTRTAESGRRLAAAISSGDQSQLASLAADPDTQAAVLPYLQAAATRNLPPQGFMADPQNPGRVIPQPGGPADPNYMAAASAAGRDPIIPLDGQLYDRRALTPGAQPGAPQAPAGQPGPAPAPAPPAGGTAPVLAQLQSGESGGNPNAVSPQGATGLFQFTPATWQGVASGHPELNLTPSGITDPQQQQRAAQAHAQDILRDLAPYVGRPGPGGQPITPDMLIRGAWIGGTAGMQRYLGSGGQYNPRDAFGTSIGDYFTGTARNLRPMQQAAAPGAPGAQIPDGGIVPQGTPAPQLRGNPNWQQRSAQPVGGSRLPSATGGAPAQVAQAGPATAADGAAPAPDVRTLLPDRSGVAPPVAPPPVDGPNLVLRRQPGSLTPGPSSTQVQQARSARQEFYGNQEVKYTLRVSSVLASMEDAISRPTAASDLNLIYGIATILDPGSVVREGEAVMVRNTQSLPDNIRGTIDRVLRGEATLQPEDRQRIMAEVRSRAAAQMRSYNDLRDSEDGFLRASNLNPDAVFGPRITLPQAVPTLSAVDAEIARRQGQR